jgi:4-hydroxy-3-methylbut-2-en-1-yl diphosphate reductase
MKIEIDNQSGFCYGVVKAIQSAEEALKASNKLYCLGDIVHNNAEIKRLEALGMHTINHEEFKQLHDCKVLIRAHGEPPETYEIARQNNIELIDASCPVVLKLQTRIRRGYEQSDNPDTQMVIYGKQGHAEVIGLVGQVPGRATVISKPEDIDQLDFTRPVQLFSQTTKGMDGFLAIEQQIRQRMEEKLGITDVPLTVNDTICRQVSSRVPRMREFSHLYDVIVFVSGKSSSNGKQLYEICLSENPRTYMVSEPTEIEVDWFKGVSSVGICGATSTPKWLMEQVAEAIKNQTIEDK